VTVVVAIQPPVALKLITDVPGETPVTTPDEFIVATNVLELLQVPPELKTLRVVVPPAHTDVFPVIVVPPITIVTGTVFMPAIGHELFCSIR
jgi:hypothetical protein